MRGVTCGAEVGIVILAIDRGGALFAILTDQRLGRSPLLFKNHLIHQNGGLDGDVAQKGMKLQGTGFGFESERCGSLPNLQYTT